MAECKHEVLRVHWARGNFECMGNGCFVCFEKKEIVIRTKAYDQAREDVIAKAKAVMSKYDGALGLILPMNALRLALDALERELRI